MDIFFRCDHCSQRLVVDEAGVGMEISCPRCSKQVAIPPKSTISPDEIEDSQAPDISLPPPSPITIVPRSYVEPPPHAAPAPREDVVVPQDLRAPLAPPRVRRPPGRLPPPRALKPAPSLPPSVVETLAPVPSHLHAPAAPRRVGSPPTPLPPPRALQPVPLLRPEVVAAMKQADTPAPGPEAQSLAGKPLPASQQPEVVPPSMQGIVPPPRPKSSKNETPSFPPMSPPTPPPPPSPEPLPVKPAPVSVVPSTVSVRLVETGGPVKTEAGQWQGLAVALSRQLWNDPSPTALRAAVIEAFLLAMPRLIAVDADPTATTDASAGRNCWRDPFAGEQVDILGRFERADFEGMASRVADLIERWMQHQEGQARQPDSNAEDLEFSLKPVPNSAVVSFGMNYRQRGEPGRKRVACWVARAGDDRFLFAGKIPPSLGMSLPGFVPSFRAETGEASVPMPREEIFALPPPPNVDAEDAREVRQWILNFCEAYHVRFDNRLAAEFYDRIRRRREIVRAVIPGMLQVMPPSREKRMLQQLSREL